jgi:antitoxin component YwqK of YwqJK toxin-antitoxin module
VKAIGTITLLIILLNRGISQTTRGDSTFDRHGRITKVHLPHGAVEWYYYRTGGIESKFFHTDTPLSNGDHETVLVDSSFYHSGTLQQVTKQVNDTLTEERFDDNGAFEFRTREVMSYDGPKPAFVRDGWCSYYFKGVLMEKHFYRMGTLLSKEVYDPNGRIAERRKYMPESNAMEVAIYDTLGYLAQTTTYVNRLEEGPSTFFFHNGRPSVVIQYVAGKITEASSFYPGGKKVEKTAVVSGNGVIYFTEENGKICCSCDVKNGVIGNCDDLLKRNRTTIKGKF